MKKDNLLHLFLLFHRFLTVSLFEPLTPDGKKLTNSQLVCLRFLYLHPHSTAGELARGLNVSCGACTRTMDRLEQKGLAMRVTSPKDRRVQQMALSPKGKEFVEKAYKQLMEKFQGFMAKLSSEEVIALESSLCTFLSRGLDNLQTAEAACLHCGLLHMTDCPANISCQELAGREMEG